MQPSTQPSTRPRPGLTSAEAQSRLQRHGRNDLGPPRRRPLAVRVLTQLRDPLIVVLLVAAGLTAAIGDLSDMVVILAVIVANTAIGVSQEVKADRAIAALTQMAAPTARVVRDGRQAVVPAAEVVPGDLVVLEAGDVVPADARLVEAPGLQVDEAALTGESVPVDKTRGHAEDEGAVFAGTVVTRGRATAEVTATGRDSTLGRIAGLMDVRGGLTPLQKRLAGLGRVLAGVAVVLSAVVMVSGLVRGQELTLMVVTAVSLVVAAVPESLPAVTTLSLALGARRMARRHAIVRRLPAVETLGSVTVLATDKTGTLTEGRMVAERLWTPQHVAVVTGTGYAPVGEILLQRGPHADEVDGALTPDVRDLLATAAICTDARIVPPAAPGEDWTALGDPTEAALLAVAGKAGLDAESLAADCPRLAEIPFDSVRRRMTTVHRVSGTFVPRVSGAHHVPGRVLVACKGAPDMMLRPELLADDGAVLDEARRHADRLAAEGFRVLAVARAWRAGTPDDEVDPDVLERGLSLLGLVALADPPRAAAAHAVQACRDAGVVPVLITGDHPATARAIADRLGIERVHARTTPGQKLDLVTQWQQDGEVVAMTGDGVNDGPALRRADIGVAMGRRGTEVAKQAADLVLADDDLGTVVVAVEEGRRVYANVRRFLRYAMSGGAAEIMVMLAGPVLGMAVPLLPAQILWVNLMTHGVPGVALGAEPGEPGAMGRRPRSPAESVLGGGLWQQVVWLGAVIAAVCLGVGAWGLATDRPWQSMVFVTLGLLQLGVALGLRARPHPDAEGSGNPFLLLAVGVAVVLQVGVLYWGPAQTLFSTDALGPDEMAVVLASSTVGYVAVRVSRRRESSRRP